MILRYFLLSLLLSACTASPQSWRARQDVSVFAAADDRDQLLFTVKKGDICKLGREQVAKIYQYREIECKQGRGWIAYPYPFDPVPPANQAAQT